jgi:hypothetical protein
LLLDRDTIEKELAPEIGDPDLITFAQIEGLSKWLEE